MNLFVYGTLLFPEIREYIGGRCFGTRNAILRGFEVRRVKGAVYPGLAKLANVEDGEASGEILAGISNLEMRKFDDYEGEFYERVRVKAVLESGELEECFTYLVPGKAAAEILATEEWRREWFAEHHLTAYLGRVDKLPDDPVF